jgi:hypothetical protein
MCSYWLKAPLSVRSHPACEQARQEDAHVQLAMHGPPVFSPAVAVRQEANVALLADKVTQPAHSSVYP